MSLKLNRRIYNQEYTYPEGERKITAIEKSILEALALIGTDSTGGDFIIDIYPSQETIAAETLFSLATIKRALKAWIKRRVLIVVKTNASGVKVYKIDLARLNDFLVNPVLIGHKATHSTGSDRVTEGSSYRAEGSSHRAEGSSHRATTNFYKPLQNNWKAKTDPLKIFPTPPDIKDMRENALIDMEHDRRVDREKNRAAIKQALAAVCGSAKQYY